MDALFLTSALVDDELSASRPGHFTPGTHWRLRGPQSRSGRYGGVKVLLPPREIETDSLVVQPVS
jgi:hypothetical protein